MKYILLGIKQVVFGKVRQFDPAAIGRRDGFRRDAASIPVQQDPNPISVSAGERRGYEFNPPSQFGMRADETLCGLAVSSCRVRPSLLKPLLDLRVRPAFLLQLLDVPCKVSIKRWERSSVRDDAPISVPQSHIPRVVKK